MTTIREIADKHFPDTRPANEPNRQAMCDTNAYSRKTCEAALREFGEELAKDSQERAKQLGQLAAEAEERNDTKEALRLLNKKEEALLASISIRAAIRESL